MSNAMFIVQPYKQDGVWAFDDAQRGLVREPFVFGADEMVEKYSADIPDAHAGFELYFSSNPFPGYQGKLEWLEEEYVGNWYRMNGTEERGWLCPALLKFFETPPKEIFFKAQARKGVQ